MSDQATPNDPGAEQAAETTTPGVDFGPVFERMEQMGSRLESTFNERLASMQPQQNEPEPEDPYATLDGYYEDPGQAAEARQALEGILSPLLEQATKPLLDKIAELENGYQSINADLELGGLEAKYPRLANDQQLADAVLDDARKFAEAIGNPRAAASAQVIETVYLARMGRDRAAGETPAGGAPTGLEAAGGASPAQPEPDIAKQILNAGTPTTKASMFWGA